MYELVRAGLVKTFAADGKDAWKWSIEVANVCDPLGSESKDPLSTIVLEGIKMTEVEARLAMCGGMHRIARDLAAAGYSTLGLLDMSK